MPLYPVTNHPGIQIFENERDPKFYNTVWHMLRQLDSRPVGASLLDIIDKRAAGTGNGGQDAAANGKFRCTIARYSGFRAEMQGGAAAQPINPQSRIGPRDFLGAKQSKWPVWDKATEGKSAARVKLGVHGDITKRGTPHGGVVFIDPDTDFSETIDVETPAFIILGHELIHYIHYVSGDLAAMPEPETQIEINPKDYVSVSKATLYEEARTVGLGPFKNGRISENKLRAEHNLPLRPDYSGCTCENLPSLVTPRKTYHLGDSRNVSLL